MADLSLTLRQTTNATAVNGGATYEVKNEVTASVGISPAVFVYKTATQAFSHYATPADMDGLLDTYEAALAAGAQFYRQTSVTRTWTTISAMNEDLAVTRARLRALLRETSKLQGPLETDTTVVLTAD